MAFYTEFAEYYESIFPYSETVYGYLRRYLSPAGPKCLDVGCGTGLYCERLAKDGFQPVGIDLDQAMIDYAEGHYPGIEFHAMNMLDITQLDRQFDAVFCIGNTASHLNPTQLGSFLDSVRELLKPGGSWILQVMNWDFILEREHWSFPIIRDEARQVAFFREYLKINPAELRFQTRLEVEGRTLFEDSVPMYPLRVAEYEALHAERGYTKVDHVGSYAGAAFDPAVFSASIFAYRA